MEEERRRGLLSAGKKPPEPLLIYQTPNKALSAGTITKNTLVQFGGTSYGQGAVGIFVQPRARSGGYTAQQFSIAGIDATEYSRLIIEYECGTTQKGYVVAFTDQTKVGWGYSASSANVNYAEYRMPRSYSTSGTAEFDIKGVKGNICIGGYCAEGSDGYPYFIKCTNIWLE